MKKLIGKLFKKQEVKGKVKLKNNNKGFSLIELLIVIAIMGVLAAIAFNMFGGVLSNTKKRADDQMAKNITNAVLTYCVDSGDWGLASIGAGLTDMTLVEKLMDIVTHDSKEYGPMLSKKDPTQAANVDANLNPYKPQWNANNGGDHEGWTITVYKKSQTVTVKPRKTGEPANVSVSDS